MIKLIGKYLKGPALACAIIAPTLMFVEVLMDLQQPVLMANIIDVGVANRDVAYVLHTGLKMIACALVGFLGGAGCSIFAAYAAVTMSGKMRQGLFGKIQSLSFAEIDRFRTSSLVTRLTNDVMQMQQMTLMTLRIMVRSPLTLTGSVFMCLTLSPRLALLFCAILPLVTVGIVLVLAKSVPAFARVQKSLDRINTIMRENLLGARLVKTFNMESRQAARFADANGDLTEKSVSAQNLTFILLPAVTLVMNLSVVAALWFGGHMVAPSGSTNGTSAGPTVGLAIGTIMAFVNYLVQITHSLMMAVNLVVNISRAGASAERINEVLDTKSSIDNPPAPRVPARWNVEFENVGFRYNTAAARSLSGISFSVAEGETVGIIGATGSGKTTLASLIPRLYDATDGRVLIGGTDVREVDIAALRTQIAFVMQESLLFSGTIADNLRFGDGAADDERQDGALKDAQALDFVAGLTAGRNSPVEQRGRNFSGGQKQRLSLARAFLKDPKILILDDSTSAVDLKTEAAMRGALARRMKGKTVIVIAQRVSAVMNADRIVVLDFGKVAACGTHAELVRTSDIYRSIVASQLGAEAISHAI
jgi:ATP-binding cassette subfamily B protein